jgi:hypothetical protein
MSLSSEETSPHQGGSIEASQFDPLRPVEHLLQWTAQATVQIALGLLLGELVARLMRHRHLHWGWAAVALAFLVAAHALLGGSALALDAVALTATVRGRRWHREDLEVGADLAEIAADRHHPGDALRAAGRVLDVGAVPWLRGGAAAGGPREGELLLGRDRHGRAVSIELGDRSKLGQPGGAHTLVVGATGSGKTVTQTLIVTQAIARGMAAVVIDPKGDRALRAAVRLAARNAGRRLQEWTPTGPSVYNPYARGSETEIADRVLAGERYTEPHYQRQAQRYLGHAVRALSGAGRQIGLAEIVRMLDPAQLEVLARELAPERARAIHAYLDSLTPRQRSDLAGVRDRLAIMVESDVGPWLDPDGSAARFDLLEALRERAVVYFGLQADSRPLLAQMLGGAIVQDLQSAISALQSDPLPALVLIDEFSAIAAERVAGLFGRARSAGVSLLLGTQELSDLRLPGREALLEQVLGNLTSIVAHRQVVPDSAELISRLAGARGAWSTSWSSDGRGTRKRVREPLLPIEEVRGLACGWAAVIRLTGRAPVAVARVLPPGRRR